jgi:hypothetical protein
MSVTDLILVVFVAAGAFYAGFQVGRFKALAERGSAGGAQPLPGPLDGPFGEASSSGPARPRGIPAGGADDEWTPDRRAPPRRSAKPPPAAAGLMGGSAEKPASRQK